MLERSRRVVLLIDYDNLQICASRDTPGRDLQLTPVVQLAQKYGTVILARAYAEWNLSTERLAVYKAGIEPAFAPVLRTESDRSGKSLADTVMVAEGMDMLWTLSPEVVVLATSDKDLIPLVRVAKQRGAFVVVLGSDFTAIPLREMADEHITYKQLITDNQGRYTTEAGPLRQPAAAGGPEPVRRRTTRERNGREARPAAASTTATPAARPERESRPEREPRESRPEREAPPAASPTPIATPAATGAPEPVAPFAAAAPGEVDGPMGVRRRRRRGSRRRTERLGVGPDGVPYGPGDGGDADAHSENDVAELEAPAEEIVEPVVVEPELEEAPAEVAAPVRRPRRTTRRNPLPADESAAAPAEAAQPVSEPVADATPPDEAAADAPDGAEDKPARRPRRVASSTRGRTRAVR
jgi:uncharacterized LabA/DUF88 family protein